MGKKSRGKKEAKQISSAKNNKPYPEMLSELPNQPKSAHVDNPYQVIRRNICPASAFVSAVLFGFGGQEMSTGSVLAPWLMAFGALMVAGVNP